MHVTGPKHRLSVNIKLHFEMFVSFEFTWFRRKLASAWSESDPKQLPYNIVTCQGGAVSSKPTILRTDKTTRLFSPLKRWTRSTLI